MDAARTALPRVRCPVLIVQSKVDETVHPTSAEIIYNGLGSTQKRIMWLARSRHNALLDVESERIQAEILAHGARSGD